MMNILKHGMLTASIFALLLLMGCASDNLQETIPSSIQNASGEHDTSLTYAMQFGSLEGTKEAVTNGADIDTTWILSPYPHSVNSLEYANSTNCSNNDIFEYLLENGADLDLYRESDGYTLLMSAAASDSIKTCEKYLNLGADINLTGNNGENALDAAALTKKTSSCMCL